MPRIPRPDPETVRERDALRRQVHALRAELEEYRIAQVPLRDTEQRLRALVEQAPIVVFAIDRDGIFTLSEGHGLVALGLRPGQVVGQSAYDVYRDVPRIVDNVRRCLAGESINEVVQVGDLVFESIYTPRRDEHGFVAGVSGVAWDVTQRVRAETVAKELEIQLQQAQKIETIGTLAGGIAHDFNNILSPIIGYTEIAMDQLANDHPARADMEQVMNAAIRAKELVQQILVFARGGSNERRPLQLHLVIHEALRLVRSTLPSTIEISQRVATRGDTVVADPAQMHQVIMNLCTNAAHAMRESGGVLRIELVGEDVSETTAARVAGINPGPYVVLTVRDQGTGMDAATMARVFEPFFTTKKSGEGTGLGLSVVHGIVHSHGGAVTVESDLGRGSVFRVYLPSASAEAEEALRHGAAESRGQGEHVLVVDDEADVTQLLERILVARGYRVTSFTSSEEALNAFRRDPASFRAVITDQTMPRLTGIELARQLKALRPGVAVILTTGYGENLVSPPIGSGVDAIAAKPFDAAALAQTLRRTLTAE
ncbi:MAG TPA: ATP-binding protein [Candidatus Krumholzibacteria bacterium]|nr:ATP-binding protein [Candidatus Krumholzibacteria bacterium]